MPLARRVWAYACGFSALQLAAAIKSTERSASFGNPNPLWILRLQLKDTRRTMKLSLALALAPVAAFVAPVLLSVEGITKNGPLAAEIWASRPNPKQRCCAAPTRAVALRFSHRRMLRLPRMAGGDENSRVRAALPLRRGRLLSESWKPRQYHAGPWLGAAGIRPDWYFGDSSEAARHTHAVAALENDISHKST